MLVSPRHGEYMVSRKVRDKGLAKRLAVFMKAKGENAHSLARKAGLKHQVVYKWLAGESVPSWDAVQLVALALGVSLDQLRNPHLRLPDVPPARPVGRPRKAEPPGERSSEEEAP